MDNVERLMGIYCANNCGKHATAMVQAMERSVGLVEEGRREEDSKEGEGPRRVNTDSLVMSLLDCEARLAELQGIEAVNEAKREHTRKQHAESLSVSPSGGWNSFLMLTLISIYQNNKGAKGRV